MCGLVCVLIARPLTADECSDFRAALLVKESISQAWEEWEDQGGKCNTLDKSDEAQELCQTKRALVAAFDRAHDEVRKGRNRVEATITNETNLAVHSAVTDVIVASAQLDRLVGKWKRETGREFELFIDNPIFPSLDKAMYKLNLSRWTVYDEVLKVSCRLRNQER